MDSRADWLPGPDAWKLFVHKHPELGYRPGRMNFHNFLRYYRQRLVETDSIRRAKNKFWIAHVERFCSVAFDCATGHCPGAQIAHAPGTRTASFNGRDAITESGL